MTADEQRSRYVLMNRKLINLYARAQLKLQVVLSLVRHKLNTYAQKSDYKVYRAPPNTGFKTTLIKVGNSVAIIGVFIGVAVMINEPLRTELAKSVSLIGLEVSSVSSHQDMEREPTPSLKKVLFGIGRSTSSNSGELLSPEVLNLPVPSIEPLAKQIPGKIDPEAQDARLMASLPDQQKVANFMANKYRLDPNAINQYVSHAIVVAKEVDLDPVLLVAVMSIESNFNPNIQSNMGAQGLMQVLTRVHADKFVPYGGTAAAFKPEANIRVGAYILKYFIAQAGSLQGGLRYYVGGAAFGDGGYAGKVMREREQLIALLKNVDITNVPLEVSLALINKVLPVTVKQDKVAVEDLTVQPVKILEVKEQDS